jgi:hypothetical protein
METSHMVMLAFVVPRKFSVLVCCLKTYEFALVLYGHQTCSLTLKQ